MLAELSEYLSYDDINEIKKQINLLNKEGRLLPERIRFMELHQKSLASAKKEKDGDVTRFVFENPNFAILIAVMQFTSSFVAEILCMITIGG